MKKVDQDMEERVPEAVPASSEAVRKQLNLEWVDSKWFRVWLELARHQNQEN